MLIRVLVNTAVSSTSKSSGTWDSIHVFEATDRARTCHYKLTSTVILNMVSSGETLGELDLSGNMTRQLEQDLPIDDESSHIANIGRLVEDMELKMRNLLQEVYFGKAKDVVSDLRSEYPTICDFSPIVSCAVTDGGLVIGVASLSATNKDRGIHQEMISAMRQR